MFSVQRILGRDDEFCALFEASASEGVSAVAALKPVLNNPGRTLTLEAFAAARRKDKEITAEIADLLTRALVTSFDREDIEALADSLYKIPKTVEKFAERYIIAFSHVKGFDFTRQIMLMDEAVNSVLEMVRAFRDGAGVGEIKRMDSRIQRLESEADDTVMHLMKRFMDPAYPTIQGIVLKDLVELNERVVDRCRDASATIARFALKVY